MAGPAQNRPGGMGLLRQIAVAKVGNQAEHLRVDAAPFHSRFTQAPILTPGVS